MKPIHYKSIRLFIPLSLLLITALALSSCSGVKRSKLIKVDGKIKTAEDIKIKSTEKIFNIGEKMTFKINWLGIPVGKVVSEIKGMEIIRGRKAYRIELIAETNPFMSAIFPVRDRYTSFFDAEDLCTLRHEVIRKEGFYRKDAYTDFYQKEHYAYFKNLLDGSEKTFDIPQRAQDTLTAFYYLRSLDLKLGDRIKYNVVNSEKNYTVFGNITKKEFLRVKGLGTFEAFLIHPDAEVDGKRSTRGTAICYFSADSQRLPLIAILRSYLFTKIIVTLVNYEQGKDYDIKEN